MEISALTLKLIILLTPGALAATIYKRLTLRHKEQSDFMFVIVSIMQGMFSYLILQVIIYGYDFSNNILFPCHPWDYNVINTFKNISDSNTIPYSEVIYASIISIFLGFVTTKIDDSKIIYSIARRFGVSNKYGDENLYSYFLNSPDISWVYLRDLANSLTYFGSVKSFSETQEFKEIVLEQVTVFNYPDSDELYDIERIYLCLPKDKVIIEQAKIKQNGQEQTEKQNGESGATTN
jgi:hypothetical protein